MEKNEMDTPSKNDGTQGEENLENDTVNNNADSNEEVNHADLVANELLVTFNWIRNTLYDLEDISGLMTDVDPNNEYTFDAIINKITTGEIQDVGDIFNSFRILVIQYALVQGEHEVSPNIVDLLSKLKLLSHIV